MVTMLMLSLLVAVLYAGIAAIKERELPESVSALVYHIPKGGWRWLWTLWLWTVAILLAPSLMEAMPGDWRFVGFLTLGCLLFVGAMPLGMNDSNATHNTLGIAAGVLSQVCVILINPLWLLVWAGWLCLFCVMLFTTNNRLKEEMYGKGVFCLEAFCAASLYGALLTT